PHGGGVAPALDRFGHPSHRAMPASCDEIVQSVACGPRRVGPRDAHGAEAECAGPLLEQCFTTGHRHFLSSPKDQDFPWLCSKSRQRRRGLVPRRGTITLDLNGSIMTYCVGIKLKAGLVLLSDTRTNAGIDNIARYRKTFIFEDPGRRVLALLTAGNLGITQGVVTRVSAGVKRSDADPGAESIMTCESLYQAADIVGEAMREAQKRDRQAIESQGSAADATLLLAGQQEDGELR